MANSLYDASQLGKHWGTHSSTLRSCGNFETHSPPRLGAEMRFTSPAGKQWPQKNSVSAKPKHHLIFHYNYFSPPSWRYPTLTDETVELLPQTWDTVCGLQFGQILRSQIIFWHVPRLQQSYPMQSAHLLRYPDIQIPEGHGLLNRDPDTIHTRWAIGIITSPCRTRTEVSGSFGHELDARWNGNCRNSILSEKKVFHGTRWYKR